MVDDEREAVVLTKFGTQHIRLAPGDTLAIIDGCLVIANGMITKSHAWSPGTWEWAYIQSSNPPEPEPIDDTVPF